MLLWVEPLIWGVTRILGYILSFVGLAMLVYLGGRGLIYCTNYIIEEIDHEDQD